MFNGPSAGGPGAALIGTYTWCGRDTEARISSENGGHSLQWNNGFQNWVFEQAVGGQWRESTSGKNFVLTVEEDPEDCSKVSAVVVHRAQVAGQNASNGTRWVKSRPPAAIPMPAVPAAARSEPVVQRAELVEDSVVPQLLRRPSAERQDEMRLSLDDRAAGLSSCDVSPLGAFSRGGITTSMEDRAQFSLVEGVIAAKPPRLQSGSVSDPRLVNLSADLTGISKLSFSDDDDDQAVEALFAPAIPDEGGCQVVLRIVSTGGELSRTPALHKAPDMLLERPSCAVGLWFADGGSIMLSDLGELIQIHNGEAKALGDLDGSMALQNGNVVLLTVDRAVNTLTVERQSSDSEVKSTQCTVEIQGDGAICKGKLCISLTRPGSEVKLESYERW